MKVVSHQTFDTKDLLLIFYEYCRKLFVLVVTIISFKFNFKVISQMLLIIVQTKCINKISVYSPITVCPWDTTQAGHPVYSMYTNLNATTSHDFRINTTYKSVTIEVIFENCMKFASCKHYYKPHFYLYRNIVEKLPYIYGVSAFLRTRVSSSRIIHETSHRQTTVIWHKQCRYTFRVIT